MEEFLYLSWFYRTKKFNNEINELLRTGYPTVFLKNKLLEKKDEIKFTRGKLKKYGMETLHYLNDDYPKTLKNIDFPPLVLTCFGDRSLLNNLKSISIVGSRAMDQNTEFWLYENIRLISSSCVLISGGANGVDQAVHKASIRAGYGSIFVLPSGIFKPYPNSLKPFLKSVSNRLFVSSFHPFEGVKKYFFHPRNYLLAALGKKLIIAQSEIKSGSMVTAKYGLDLGKEIFTIPASPWDHRFSGNLKLLEEGATPILNLKNF